MSRAPAGEGRLWLRLRHDSKDQTEGRTNNPSLGEALQGGQLRGLQSAGLSPQDAAELNELENLVDHPELGESLHCQLQLAEVQVQVDHHGRNEDGLVEPLLPLYGALFCAGVEAPGQGHQAALGGRDGEVVQVDGGPNLLRLELPGELVQQLPGLGLHSPPAQGGGELS